MTTMLEPGAEIVLPRHGSSWRIDEVLGEGGEGRVYALRSAAGDGGDRLALKWYWPEAAHPDRLTALTALTQRPAPSDAYLWPLETVTATDGSFGYVMAIRPPQFRPVADLLTGTVDVPFSVVVRLCMGLADAFLRLHAQGLCYRDISLGNVLFDPSTGAPLVCDTDNVGIDGHERARVLGTSRFMAPEVVRGEAQPSIATDLYSLAVLVFYLLMLHHPLLGRRELQIECFDREAERLLFGSEPVFAFDPQDDSNRPDPVVHGAVLAYWPLYPAYIRDDFVRAFTVGLVDPQRRVREGVWRSHLSRLLDGIARCACGRENFTDDGVAVGPCWSCGADLPPSVRLRLADRVLVLNPGTRLTRHHLRRDYDHATTVGSVVAHPERPDVWGLRNDSDGPWTVTGPDDVVRMVEPGRSVGLVLQTRIDLGSATAVIEG